MKKQAKECNEVPKRLLLIKYLNYLEIVNTKNRIVTSINHNDLPSVLISSIR
jgi:hypothetical protein